MTYHLLIFSNTTPMAMMHRHVNEWHSSKARNKRRNPNLGMLKDKQACEAKAQRLIEPKTYEKKLNRESM